MTGIADEMRHLTPVNYAIKGSLGAGLSSSAHDASPYEDDARNFADILYYGKAGIISDF